MLSRPILAKSFCGLLGGATQKWPQAGRLRRKNAGHKKPFGGYKFSAPKTLKRSRSGVDRISWSPATSCTAQFDGRRRKKKVDFDVGVTLFGHFGP